jgi:PBP4 family serine-type D-alanyl-D-alanine carboxypeptidase
LYPYTPPSTSALAASQTLHEEGQSEGQSKVTASGEPEDDQDGEVSALSFYDNTIGIRVVPVRSGAPVVVRTEPRTEYFHIINRATATRGRRSKLRLAKSKGSNTIVLTGKVSLRSRGLVSYVRVDDPAAFGAYLLKESLERYGIAVSGIAESHHGGGIPYRDLHELAKHESPPLIDAISIINKRSDNAYAELLLRLVGTEVRGRGTAEAGISVVQELVRQTGVDPNELSINDGSGLSKANALSPHAEISLLRYVTQQHYYPSFVSSLAVAGTDGTLKHRLSNGATVQRIFGKTGTLANVVALGGFLYSLQGKRLAFVIFCNNFLYGAGSARHGVDEIVELLARHDYGKPENGSTNLSGAQENGRLEPFGAITRPVLAENFSQAD